MCLSATLNTTEQLNSWIPSLLWFEVFVLTLLMLQRGKIHNSRSEFVFFFFFFLLYPEKTRNFSVHGIRTLLIRPRIALDPLQTKDFGALSGCFIIVHSVLFLFTSVSLFSFSSQSRSSIGMWLLWDIFVYVLNAHKPSNAIESKIYRMTLILLQAIQTC